MGEPFKDLMTAHNIGQQQTNEYGVEEVKPQPLATGKDDRTEPGVKQPSARQDRVTILVGQFSPEQ